MSTLLSFLKEGKGRNINSYETVHVKYKISELKCLDWIGMECLKVCVCFLILAVGGNKGPFFLL